ncbi:Oncostatin-M [Myotis brandtii]|uniref:Oncostatin-M n=1 Tax=Myotis brandtii TaxID=109478 RepID=S7MZ98_MYOBR|nr:PREDICTED: oncostatin-M [Myotis brandtii]EPQ09916.1 Oncostatin-M [Myotis brandtii]
MWAQPMRRTLLSLILRLLFLNPVSTGTCPGDGQKLLEQLWNQANLLQDTSLLLDPYIRIQGLDMSGLKQGCQERPGVFPSKQALQGLSRTDFLRTLRTQLGQVLHRLQAFQQDMPDVQAWGMAIRYIHGIRNNIHCMEELLPGSPETAEPPQAGLGTSPPPTRTPDAFQLKLKGCRFLRGFHRFMHSAKQVFHEWRETLRRRSRRQSPRQARQRGVRRARGMQPSRRGRRLVPRGQLPR